MKILHIAPIGHHSEGIGSVLQNLCPAQIRSGNDVRIITVYVNNIYHDLPIENIKTKSDFKRYINNWLPDIVVLHSHFHIEYVHFVKVLKKRKVPYCVQLHGALSMSNYQRNHLKKFFAGLLIFNSILKGADTIIYLNKAEYLNSIVPKYNSRYVIIPNGCDQPDNLDLSRPVNNPIEIVFIGRIRTNHKGLDVLCQAVRKLDDMGNNRFHFSFYGNEDDIDVAYLVKEIENTHIANYCGSAYGEKKDSVLRHADFFILTSRYEGMPMGVLEAWSYGVPCILTEGTNMTGDDVIKNAYWKSDLDSNRICETITGAVEQFVKTPFTYRMAALEESKKYNWDTIASNTIDLFKTIIQRRIS